MTSLQAELYRLRQLFVATDRCFVVLENVDYRKHVNIKFYVLLYKSPSETFQIHEELHVMVAVKKTQDY
jgi:hypothetical protein